MWRPSGRPGSSRTPTARRPPGAPGPSRPRPPARPATPRPGSPPPPPPPPGGPGGSCPSPRARSSVTSRCAPSRAATSASSRSRPTKLVSCRGRLWGRASSVRRGGKSAGRSGCSSWTTRSGRCRSSAGAPPGRGGPPPPAGRPGRPPPPPPRAPPAPRGRSPSSARSAPGEPVVARAVRRPGAGYAPASPRWTPIRARNSPVAPQASRCRASCPSRAAATASVGRANTTYTASPTVSNTTPSAACTAPWSRSSWRRTASR